MIFLVRQHLVLQAGNLVAIGQIGLRLGMPYLIVFATIDGYVFHRLYVAVGRVVFLHVARVVRVCQHVEGIVVEGELVLLAVSRCQRSPAVQSVVVGARGIACAAVHACLFADVSRREVGLDFAHGLVEGCCQFADHGIVEQFAVEDVVLVVELQGIGADVGDIELRLGRIIQLPILRPGDGRARVDRLRRAVQGVGHLLCGNVGTAHRGLLAVARVAVLADHIVGDNLVLGVHTLSEHAACRCRERRSGNVALLPCIGHVVVCRRVDGAAARLGRVPLVPVGRCVHLEADDIARVMAQVVRQAEHIVGCHVHVALGVVDVGHALHAVDLLRRQRGPECLIVCGQHHLALGVAAIRATGSGIGAGCHGDHRLLDEEFALGGIQLAPVPIGDDIVQPVGDAARVHLDTVLANLGRLVLVGIVGIEVGLHVDQLQLSVRACSDGQRDVPLAGVGRRRTGIGRQHLVVDVDAALDVPVVGLRVVRCRGVIFQVAGIAVVDDDLLLSVYEVAR